MAESNTKKRIIVVLGVTGQQGGAVASALLELYPQQVIVRGIVRNLDSDASQNLKKQGVELVQGDMDDKESILKAFEGANAAYIVTNYFEFFSIEREQQQIKNCAEAAKEKGLEHVVFSTAESTKDKLKGIKEECTAGGYYVPQNDGKAEMDQYILDLGVPTTFFLMSFLLENFLNFQGFNKIKGQYALSFTIQDKILPFISQKDLGNAISNILVNKLCLNEYVAPVSGFLKIKEMSEIMTKILGVEVIYNQNSDEDLWNQGWPGSDHISNFLAYIRIFNDEYVQRRKLSKQIITKLEGFEPWVERNAVRLRAYKDYNMF